MTGRSASSREAPQFPQAKRQLTVSLTNSEPINENGEKRSLPTGDHQAMLTKACKGDERCICINNAIFKHDSGWATAGVGRKANNPGNMRPPKLWKPSVPFTIYTAKGNGVFAKFETLEDGVQANVELYYRHYAKYENGDALVNVWADGGGDKHYRSAVKSCYSN